MLHDENSSDDKVDSKMVREDRGNLINDCQMFQDTSTTQNNELAHFYQNDNISDPNDLQFFIYDSCAKSIMEDPLDFQKVIMNPLSVVDINDYQLPDQKLNLSCCGGSFGIQQCKDEFIVNNDESTHYADSTGHPSPCPQVQHITVGMILNQQQQNELNDDNQNGKKLNQNFKRIDNKSLFYNNQILEFNSKQNHPDIDTQQLKDLNGEKRKRGRPRINSKVFEEMTFHYKCKQAKIMMNENEIPTTVSLTVDQIDDIQEEVKMPSEQHKRDKKRGRKSRIQIMIPLTHHKKRGRKPKQLIQQDIHPNIFEGQYDFSKQSKNYDIDNMVTMSILHSNNRKLSNNIDISSWSNQANIIVPQSKIIEQRQLLNQQEDRQDKEANYQQQEQLLYESDDEENTDDEEYLERHDRAFCSFMQSNIELIHKTSIKGNSLNKGFLEQSQDISISLNDSQQSTIIRIVIGNKNENNQQIEDEQMDAQVF